MPKKYLLEVKDEHGRLDKFVSEQIPDLSRTRVKELIQDDNILVNQKKEKVSYKVQAGDQIEVNVPAVKPLDVVPEDIPLDIVYEDDDVIVVNKPQGMVVHPAPAVLFCISPRPRYRQSASSERPMALPCWAASS